MIVKTIEPTTIEEAEIYAKQLLNEAYAPHEVPMPDGSIIMLCYAGRLHRAYQMRTEALRAGDTVKAQKLTAGIENLIRIYEQKQKAAADAEVFYQSMCLARDIEARPFALPDCTCAGCVDKDKHWRMAAAAGKMRASVWAFLGDAEGNGQPPVIGLFRRARQDEKARDAIWRHLLQIVDSMQVYIDECSKANEKPDWKKELWS